MLAGIGIGLYGDEQAPLEFSAWGTVRLDLVQE